MRKVRIYDKLVVPVQNKADFLNSIIDKRGLLIAMNAKKVVSKSPLYRSIINSHIAYPDGQSVVRALRKKGVHSLRYPGSQLWLDLIRNTCDKKSFYLIGARQAVVEKTVAKLRQAYPQIDIRDYRNGYFREGDELLLAEDLRTKEPDVVFVAMHYQRQDFLMNDLYEEYPALYVGLGGSFDIYAGVVKTMPQWWQHYIRSEGLYRVLKDPKKLPRLLKVFKFLIYYYTDRL